MTNVHLFGEMPTYLANMPTYLANTPMSCKLADPKNEGVDLVSRIRLKWKLANEPINSPKPKVLLGELPTSLKLQDGSTLDK